jgi:MoaA/NifB/PqqE/SkfB family radical SAM enzyme
VPTLGDQLLTEEQFTKHSTVTTLPREICFDFDYTCNFRCPSCRTDIINHNHGPIADVNRKLVERIKHSIIDLYIEKDATLIVRWAGGEPFLSHAYLDLWDYISQHPSRIKNVIQTNGSYLSRRDNLLEKFLPYVSELRISFDAASAETYSKIRVNGVWEDLLDNCLYIKELITRLGCSTRLVSDFVVQLDNYKEIPKYIEIVKDLGFNKINLSRMWNWDTWDMDEFARLNISDSNHPDHQELLEILAPYRNDRGIHISV